MGTEKRQRQKEGRQARIAAAEAARRKADGRRRIYTFAGLAALVVLLIVGFQVLSKKDDSTDTATTDSSSVSSSEPAVESAAGKPCVAVTDPLPAGAPAVPVQEGPPPTELIKQDLVEGTGAVVNEGDTLTVNYIGVACSTGKIFDSSYTTGKPATFALTEVIQGWRQGIPGMKVGGQRLLGIPSELGYGAAGGGTDIAPDEALWFVVEVTAATPASTTSSAPQ